jgi:hypothetical protein
VERGQEKPRGNADRLLHVVMFGLFLSRGDLRDAEVDSKDNNQICRSFEKFFVPVRAERRKRFQPLVGHTEFITLALLSLRGLTGSALDSRIFHDHKLPGLLISAARSQ